jgi:multiple sugar transport system permease protein
MYRAIENYSFRVMRYLVLLLFAVLAFGPILWLILATFKMETELFQLPPPIVFRPTLQHYIHVLSANDFFAHLKNSIIVSLCTAFLSILIGGMAGYSLVRGRYHGKKAIGSFVLLFRMLPAIAMVIPIFLTARNFHLTNTKLVLILAYTSFNLPFATWMMRGYFVTMPIEMEEAAMIDGASKWYILTRIVFPVSFPGLFSSAISCFLLSWNEFVLALSLTSSVRSKTLPIYIVSFITPHGLLWGSIATASLLMLMPAFAFGLFAQRYIVEGYRAGISK